jgi:hypothetical protein
MGRVALHADGHAETGDGIYWAELSMSPSDTFVLLWRDATDDDSTIGYRTGGLGRYRLIEKGVGLRCDGRLERPNDGHVANNGAFIIADWLFTDELRSRLHIFSAEGESLVRRDNRANVLRRNPRTSSRAKIATTRAWRPSGPESAHSRGSERV